MQRVKLSEVVMFFFAVLMAMFFGMRAAVAQKNGSCVDDPVPKCKVGERVSTYPEPCKEKGANGCVQHRKVRVCKPNATYFMAEAEKLGKENEALKQRVEKLQKELSTVQAENASQKALIAKLQEELSMLKKQLTTSDTENGTLKVRLSELETRIRELEAEVARLQAENDSLKGPFPWEFGLRVNAALRVVDTKEACETCVLKHSFSYAFDPGFTYRWITENEVLAMALGVFGRLGVSSLGDFFGGAGALAKLAIFPENTRTFQLGIIARGMFEGNSEATEINADLGFALGAQFNAWGFLVGAAVSRYGMSDQGVTPSVFLEVNMGL